MPLWFQSTSAWRTSPAKLNASTKARCEIAARFVWLPPPLPRPAPPPPLFLLHHDVDLNPLIIFTFSRAQAFSSPRLCNISRAIAARGWYGRCPQEWPARGGGAGWPVTPSGYCNALQLQCVWCFRYVARFMLCDAPYFFLRSTIGECFVMPAAYVLRRRSIISRVTHGACCLIDVHVALPINMYIYI